MRVPPHSGLPRQNIARSKRRSVTVSVQGQAQLAARRIERGGSSESSSSVLLSSLEMSDAKVYEPYIRARLGTAAHFCEVVVLKLRTAPIAGAGTASSAADRARGVQRIQRRVHRFPAGLALSSPACGFYSIFSHWASSQYRGTSLIRNCPPLGPYSRTMPRALWWS